jgi:hypothetical protein
MTTPACPGCAGRLERHGRYEHSGRLKRSERSERMQHTERSIRPHNYGAEGIRRG